MTKLVMRKNLVEKSSEIDKFLCGYTFGFDAKRGELNSPEALKSLDILIEETCSDTIILAIKAMQATPQSTFIDYKGDLTPTLSEVRACIHYIHSKNLKCILKPMVNVSNGTWRGHICFFKDDVPGEPTWSEWFESYTHYLMEYAMLAQELSCYMFVVGCELVQSNSREIEWRQLVFDIRRIYKGLITYNADKYQEDRIHWWDCVDVISSSGYYPIDDLKQEFTRIKSVVSKFHKPFFFAEMGCMSTLGSANRPNNWELDNKVSEMEQSQYFMKFFKSLEEFPFIQGLAIWDWKVKLKNNTLYDYSTYKKKSIVVIKNNYTKRIVIHN